MHVNFSFVSQYDDHSAWKIIPTAFSSIKGEIPVQYPLSFLVQMISTFEGAIIHFRWKWNCKNRLFFNLISLWLLKYWDLRTRNIFLTSCESVSKMSENPSSLSASSSSSSWKLVRRSSWSWIASSSSSSSSYKAKQVTFIHKHDQTLINTLWLIQ